MYMDSCYAQIYACLFCIYLRGTESTDAREENGQVLGEKTHRAEKIASIRGKKPHEDRVIILKQMGDHNFLC